MKKTLLLLVLAAYTATTYAGTATGATIPRYIVSKYGKLFFTTSNRSNPPACGPAGEWAVDLVGPNAAAGKAIMAAVIEAHLTGKSVHVTGNGACDVWGDRETVEVIYVE